jgi:hypothetical protein
VRVSEINDKKVFVVHGRNTTACDAAGLSGSVPRGAGRSNAIARHEVRGYPGDPAAR